MLFGCFLAVYPIGRQFFTGHWNESDWQRASLFGGYVVSDSEFAAANTVYQLAANCILMVGIFGFFMGFPVFNVQPGILTCVYMMNARIGQFSADEYKSKAPCAMEHSDILSVFLIASAALPCWIPIPAGICRACLIKCEVTAAEFFDYHRWGYGFDCNPVLLKGSSEKGRIQGSIKCDAATLRVSNGNKTWNQNRLKGPFILSGNVVNRTENLNFKTTWYLPLHRCIQARLINL